VARHLESPGHEVIVADPNYAPMYANRSRRHQDRQARCARARAIRWRSTDSSTMRRRDGPRVRAVARQAKREGDIAIGHQHRIMHVKARVGPGQHRLGLLRLEQPAAHEEPE
jgi:hypothetical protein